MSEDELQNRIKHWTKPAKIFWILFIADFAYTDDGQQSHKINFWNPLVLILLPLWVVGECILVLLKEGLIEQIIDLFKCKIDDKAKKPSRLAFIKKIIKSRRGDG